MQSIMKINNNQKKLKKILSLGILLLIVLIGAGTYAYYVNTEPNKEVVPTPEATPITKDRSGENTKNQAPNSALPSKTSTDRLDGTSQENTTGSNHDTPGPTPETPLIERASQSGSDLKIVATLAKNSNGMCELQLRHGTSALLKRSVKVTVGPSYYVCSFVVAVSDLPSSGTWDATVMHKKDNGVANSKTTSIEVKK